MPASAGITSALGGSGPLRRTKVSDKRIDEDDEQRNRQAARSSAPCLKTREPRGPGTTSPKRSAPSCETCAVDVE